MGDDLAWGMIWHGTPDRGVEYSLTTGPKRVVASTIHIAIAVQYSTGTSLYIVHAYAYALSCTEVKQLKHF